MDTLRPMLTRQQVADHLHLSLSTVGIMLRTGELHSVQIRGQYRVPRESLDAYLRGEPSPYAGSGIHAPDTDTWPPTPSMLGEDDTDPAEQQRRDDLDALAHAERVAAHHDDYGAPHPDDH